MFWVASPYLTTLAQGASSPYIYVYLPIWYFFFAKSDYLSDQSPIIVLPCFNITPAGCPYILSMKRLWSMDFYKLTHRFVKIVFFGHLWICSILQQTYFWSPLSLLKIIEFWLESASINIPDICHESHENSRVNFFWPV